MSDKLLLHYKSCNHAVAIGALILRKNCFLSRDYVMLCYVMLCYVMLCYVMLCYVISYVMLSVMLCYVVNQAYKIQ